MTEPLAVRLQGSWELSSRIDRAQNGEQREEPSLGSDPIAFLVFDKAGHFAAQFMKRDRTRVDDGPATASNNSRARGGYDAYFGSYSVDEATGAVTTRLVAALSPENVGQVFTRYMRVEGDTLTLELDTTTAAGEPVRRTLRWRRVA
jgi:lipocalin-like protein